MDLTKNWRTTSLGLTTIAGAVVNLAFSIKNKTADQTVWMFAITNILGGVGLIMAGDGASSTKAHEETKSMVADLQNQISEVKGDSATVSKPVDPNAPKP